MVGDHGSHPYKFHRVAFLPILLPLATADRVLLLLPELPLCWDALGWALWESFCLSSLLSHGSGLAAPSVHVPGTNHQDLLQW